MRDRELELSRRVLGVELHDAGPLRLERADQRRRERLQVGEHGRAVPGPVVRGAGSGSASSDPDPRAPAQEELELVRAAQLDPVPREPLEHASARTSGRTPARARPPGPADRPGRAPTRARGERDGAAGSGTSRVSPVGPSIPGDEVIWSSTRKTENTFDSPTPNRATSSNRRIGTVFTRVTPAGSTIASATASTPAAASRRATWRPSSEPPGASTRGSFQARAVPIPSSARVDRLHRRRRLRWRGRRRTKTRCDDECARTDPKQDLVELRDAIPRHEALLRRARERPRRVTGLVLPDVAHEDVGPGDQVEHRVQRADRHEDRALRDPRTARRAPEPSSQRRRPGHQHAAWALSTGSIEHARSLAFAERARALRIHVPHANLAQVEHAAERHQLGPRLHAGAQERRDCAPGFASRAPRCRNGAGAHRRTTVPSMIASGRPVVRAVSTMSPIPRGSPREGLSGTDGIHFRPATSRSPPRTQASP